MKLGNVLLRVKLKHLKVSIRTTPDCTILTFRMNITVANSPYRIDQRSAPRVPPGDNQPPAPIDPSIDKWFFISVYYSFRSVLTVGIGTLEIVSDVYFGGEVTVQKRILYIST